MTNSASAEKVALTSWQWPIELTDYDRSLAFSDSERASLENLIHRFDTRCSFWPGGGRENLDRLLRPINDVLDYLAIDNALRRRLIINTLLREMHYRRQGFWGWTQEEWVDFLRLTPA